MNNPSHAEISKRAFQLWHEHGSPAGQETETWLAAEQQLTAKAASVETDATARAARATHQAEKTAALVTARPPVEPVAIAAREHIISPAGPDQKALNRAQRKQDARAPQVPHHTGPHAKPAETGKPIWSKPHSS